MARLTLTRKAFVELYREKSVGALDDDPVIEAIANECFGGPPCKSDYDRIDRFFCIFSDLETFAQALLDSDFGRRAQADEDRTAQRRARRSA